MLLHPLLFLPDDDDDDDDAYDEDDDNDDDDDNDWQYVFLLLYLRLTSGGRGSTAGLDLLLHPLLFLPRQEHPHVDDDVDDDVLMTTMISD